MPSIIIDDLHPRTQHIQAGGEAMTHSFAFLFPVLASEDVQVAVDDTVLDIADFTVEGIGVADGGTVTLASQPAEGARITIWRDMPYERTTDFTPGADLRAAVLNEELDRTTLLLQQIEALVGDAIHRRPYDQEVDLTLPPVSERAGRYLSFDETGKPVAIISRTLGDPGNLALVYSGPAISAPTHRLNGAALEPGDLYFDTTLEQLRIWDGSTWGHALVSNSDLLQSNGSVPLAGDLDFAGNSLLNLTNLNGRDVLADGLKLDGITEGATKGDDVARDGALVNAWEIVRLDGLSAQALVNTYLDVFADETGVDVALSVDQTYDAASDVYTNPGTIEVTGMFPVMTSNTTPSGAVSGTRNGASEPNLYRLFDGTASMLEASSLDVRYDLGTGQNFQMGSYSVEVWGEGVGRYPTGFDVYGSNDGATWDVLDSQTGLSWSNGETKTFTPSNASGHYQIFRLVLTSHSGAFAQIRNIQLFTRNDPPDMTLISNAIAADVAPIELRGLIDIETSDDADANSDFSLAVSRDDGTTWTTGTLEKISGEAASRAIYAAGIDVSSQPDGSLVRLRLETHNNKNIQVHRWAVQADQSLSV